MKYILLFLFSITLLQASYTKGLQLYEQGKYQQAIEELQNSYSEYGNKKLHLLWAKSAQKLGHTKEAMSAYERVLMIDENDVKASLALLKIYKKTKRVQLALELQKKLQTLQLTQKQQEQLNNIGRVSIEKLTYSLNFSGGYDSNVNSSPDSTTFKKEDSPFLRFSGSLYYKNDLDQKDAYYVTAGGNFFHQNNINASTYNMNLLALQTGLGYKWANKDFLFTMNYTKLHFLGKDLYSELSFIPTLTLILKQNLFVKSKLYYATRSYNSSADKIRDDTKIGFDITGFYIVKKDLFFGNFTYLNYTQDKSSIINYYVDKDVYSLNVGVKHPLAYKQTTLKATYKLKYSSFKSREDTQHKIDLLFTRALSKNIENSFLMQYTTNNSDYAPAEYDKYILMFGITYRR